MKRHNLRPTSKLLVQSILKGDVLSADQLFKKLITEAEEDRQAEAAAEVDGEQFEDDIAFDEETDIDAGEEQTDEQGITDGTDTAQEDLSIDTEDELDQELANEKSSELDEDKEITDTIDDIAIIKKGVNQKMVSNLLDKLANIKNAIEKLELDPESREYITYDYSLEYYSDKLLMIQTKISEEADQSAITAALDKLKESLEQLASQAGVTDEISADNIKSPAEIKAEADDIESTQEVEGVEEVEEVEETSAEEQQDADIEQIEAATDDDSEEDSEEEVEDFQQQA